MSGAMRPSPLPDLDESELEPVLEQLGEILARLLARRWQDRQAAEAAPAPAETTRPRTSARKESPMAKPPRTRNDRLI